MVRRINKGCLRSIATPFGGSPMVSVAGARSTKFANLFPSTSCDVRILGR